MKKILLLSFLAMTVLATPVLAVDYYIDNVGGNDTTGDGSSGNPYATIEKAVLESSSGVADNFYIKGTGTTYTGTAGGNLVFVYKSGQDENNKDVYQPWPGFLRPQLQGIMISRSTGNEPTFVTIKGLYLYPGANSTTSTFTSGGGTYDARYLTLEDCELRGPSKAWNLEIITNGSTQVGNYKNLTIKNCYIHSRLSDTTTRREVFRATNLVGGGRLLLHNTRILDTTFMYEAPFGAGFYASQVVNLSNGTNFLTEVVISGCVINGNYTTNVGAGANYAAGNNSGITAFRFFGDCYFMNNTVMETGYDGAYFASLADATTTLTVKNNLFNRCVRDNTVNRGALRGDLGLGATWIAAFNTIANTGTGTSGLRRAGGSTNVHAMHNIIVNCPIGVYIGAGVQMNEYSNSFFNCPTLFSDGRVPHVSDKTVDPLLDASFNLGVGSPCIDAATDTAANLGISEGSFSWMGYYLSTQADSSPDVGLADLGLHHKTATDVLEWSQY